MLDIDRFRRGLPAPAVISFSIAAAFLAAAAAAEVNLAVSTTFAGETGNGPSFASQWDRNGRFAIFLSQAQNMIPGQSTAAADNKLFLYDRLSGSVQLVSHIPGSGTIGANAGVLFGSTQISADGNWVVYVSAATNLVSGQVDGNGDVDVFLWSRATDTTLLVSHGAASATTAGDLPGRQPAISGDGRFVTYTSAATNLVTGQVGNAFDQVFQFDRSSGANRLVSHVFNDPVRSSNEDCARPSASTDGRWVAFEALATNLVSGITDANATTDVYLWDRQAAPASALRLLSRRAGFPLSAGNGLSDSPRLSADGSGVAFRSLATNLEGASQGDTNAAADIFHYNRPADLLSLVSHRFSDLATAGNGGSGDRAPSISADGDRVAFLSGATDLVFQQVDTNNANDVFFWDNGTLTLISHVPNAVKQTANAVSTDQIVYPDGRGVVFASRASNLVAGVSDPTGDIDLFFRPRNPARVFLITHLSGDETTTLGDGSTPEAVVAGGALVGYSTEAEGVIPADGNGISDVFVHGSLLLADGFESGDFSAWSQHLP